MARALPALGPSTASRRRLLLIPLYGLLLAGGLLLGGWLMEFARLEVAPGGGASLGWMIVTALAVFALVLALPFVPGAEIGLSLMMVLGPGMALPVYLSTVLGLTLAHLVGRVIPAQACAAAFDLFGLHKARDLVLEMAALDAEARLRLLLARAPARVVPWLLRHRYLALAVALNLPGNSLIGGGGGIALSTGMSGLYGLPAYLATVAVAVAPVPLFFALSGLQP